MHCKHRRPLYCRHVNVMSVNKIQTFFFCLNTGFLGKQWEEAELVNPFVQAASCSQLLLTSHWLQLRFVSSNCKIHHVVLVKHFEQPHRWLGVTESLPLQGMCVRFPRCQSKILLRKDRQHPHHKHTTRSIVCFSIAPSLHATESTYRQKREIQMEI